MATYTSNYGWTKPSGSDNVDISVLNGNLDDQDSTIHDAFLNMAPPFSESSTYAVDDIVLYDTGLYKCHTAVVTPGSWTGSTNWQVYKLSEGGGGGGGTSDYTDLTNKPQINGVTLSGNKSTSDLGINAAGVGLGNVPNVSTNDQEPTFTEASTRNNIASGEKLSVILGKIQKFFNDLKTVAFSGSYTDLSDKPTIPTSASGITYDNTDSGLSATDVQGAVDELAEEKTDKSDIAPEFNTTTAYAKGDLCYHEGTLYEFNQAHAAGAWNSAEADEKNLAEVITKAKRYTIVKTVTTDGVKTYKELINELLSNATIQMSNDVFIRIDSAKYRLVSRSSSSYKFNYTFNTISQIQIRSIDYRPSSTDNTAFDYAVITSSGTTFTNNASTVPSQGTSLNIYQRI